VCECPPEADHGGADPHQDPEERVSQHQIHSDPSQDTRTKMSAYKVNSVAQMAAKTMASGPVSRSRGGRWRRCRPRAPRLRIRVLVDLTLGEQVRRCIMDSFKAHACLTEQGVMLLATLSALCSD